MVPVWRLRSTSTPTRWVGVDRGRLATTGRRDLAEQWASAEAAMAAVAGRAGWTAVPGRPTPKVAPPGPPRLPDRRCQLCPNEPLTHLTHSVLHRPPDGGSCEWCGQPHALVDGEWVALDRFTGEQLPDRRPPDDQNDWAQTSAPPAPRPQQAPKPAGEVASRPAPLAGLLSLAGDTIGVRPSGCTISGVDIDQDGDGWTVSVAGAILARGVAAGDLVAVVAAAREA